eukprot:GHVT01080253.1.p1 GENE.GHVT01080253.1~~GHVT01080253.1.p1  ORF type:complete len:686 (-),score=151.41 GHVT01080253.1:1696-3648(-)
MPSEEREEEGGQGDPRRTNASAWNLAGESHHPLGRAANAAILTTTLGAAAEDRGLAGRGGAAGGRQVCSPVSDLVAGGLPASVKVDGRHTGQNSFSDLAPSAYQARLARRRCGPEEEREEAEEEEEEEEQEAEVETGENKEGKARELEGCAIASGQAPDGVAKPLAWEEGREEGGVVASAKQSLYVGGREENERLFPSRHFCVGEYEEANDGKDDYDSSLNGSCSESLSFEGSSVASLQQQLPSETTVSLSPSQSVNRLERSQTNSSSSTPSPSPPSSGRLLSPPLTGVADSLPSCHSTKSSSTTTPSPVAASPSPPSFYAAVCNSSALSSNAYHGGPGAEPQSASPSCLPANPSASFSFFPSSSSPSSCPAMCCPACCYSFAEALHPSLLQQLLLCQHVDPAAPLARASQVDFCAAPVRFSSLEGISPVLLHGTAPQDHVTNFETDDENESHPHQLQASPDERSIKQAVRKLLECYCVYRPDVGYVAGVGHLASLLLCFLPPPDAFVAFANLLHSHHFLDFLLVAKPKHRRRVTMRFDFFNHLFRHRLPTLFQHFEGLGVSCDLYLMAWLLSLFARMLPYRAACRVVDNFILLGEAYAFRVALGLLKYLEVELFSCSFEGAMRLLNRPVPPLEDQLGLFDESKFFRYSL